MSDGSSLMAVAAAGFIGYAALFLARNFTGGFLELGIVRAGQVWAWGAAVAAPVLGLAVALPAHYPWNLDTAGHLGLVYLAMVVFAAGAVLSGKGLLDARHDRPGGGDEGAGAVRKSG